jgi:transcriptional regulator with XRE-family HTH domain
LKKSIYSEKQRILCDLLVKSRKKARITQAQLAKKLGRPQSFVAKYEGGERRLDVVELLEVTKILGADITSILNKIS